MRSVEYIALKQQAWARTEGIPLKRSPDPREPARYTLTVEDNLYWKMMLDPVRASFAASPGGELAGDPPALSALDSTAAMAVNLFQYWLRKDYLQQLPKLLHLPVPRLVSAGFQDQLLLPPGTGNPGASVPLDFALHSSDGSHIGIQLAMMEPYQAAHEDSFDPAFLIPEILWEGLPGCQKLATQLTQRNSGYRRLRASRLLQCVLGLKSGKFSGGITLIYLYLDTIGEEAARHRQEIRKFASATASDPLTFIAMPVQRFIARAARFASQDVGYVNYLAKRYL